MNPLLRSRTQSGVASAVDRTERKSAQGGQVERVLVAEIGSTTTVVNAFSLGNRPRFLGQGQAATSVADGDVRIGLRAA
ncbi:MAG: glutamate mutase L, partial [Bacillota bacterium]|nr:glutamate mutase L [Bacillota bacterium]